MVPVWVLTAMMVAASADLGTLSGVVRDPQGSTVANANVDVTCGKTTRHVVATAAGMFSVPGLPVTSCTVSARASGFGMTKSTIVLKAGENPFAVLTLEVSDVREDVLVSATRGVAESSFWVPESTSVTTREQLNQRPATLMAQALREEAGIEVQQTTSAQTSPIIRGLVVCGGDATSSTARRTPRSLCRTKKSCQRPSHTTRARCCHCPST